MIELKSFIVLYDGKFIRAYEESEADKVIARHKYKRCLAMANVYHLQMMLTCSNSESILFKRACRRHQKYLELADKFK